LRADIATIWVEYRTKLALAAGLYLLPALGVLLSFGFRGFGVGGLAGFVLVWVALMPLLSLVGAVFLIAVAWDIPRSLLRKEFDVVPRRLGWIHIASGAAMLAAAIIFTFGFSLVLRSLSGVHVLFIGVFVAGIVNVIQGVGILLFRSRTLGVVALLYLAVAFLAAMVVWGLTLLRHTQ
jgi:hypothetical protein